MELFHANKQWSTRPEDEKFPTIQALYDATRNYAESAKENVIPITSIRTEAIEGDVQIVGKAGNPAKLTHWAFGQLAARVGAPAGYLRELPATLACQNLNHGLAKWADKSETCNALFHSNGSLLCRALTSDRYERIWNWEVAERLLHVASRGWSPAMPTIRAMGNDKPPLYASDHDMFAFITCDAVIKEPGNPEGLRRGAIVFNSEVGASVLGVLWFLYREMCGNHIIWGAENVTEIKVRHIGDARNRWGHIEGQLRRYAESSALATEEKIRQAQTVRLGTTKEEVLDKIFGVRSIGLSRKVLEAGYDAVLPEQDGARNTVWGMAQGLTRHSQTVPYADVRTDIDRAAGKLMAANF